MSIWVLPTTFVLTRRYSQTTKNSTKKNSSWKISQVLKWKNKRGYFENDFWQRALPQQCPDVPNIHKNVVFGSVLSNNGFKLVFVSDIFVLTKNEMLWKNNTCVMECSK